MDMLEDKYDFRKAEPEWRARWETSGAHAWTPDEPREQNDVVDTPPLTVSGYPHGGVAADFSQWMSAWLGSMDLRPARRRNWRASGRKP
jgi:hypothetical protein